MITAGHGVDGVLARGAVAHLGGRSVQVANDSGAGHGCRAQRRQAEAPVPVLQALNVAMHGLGVGHQVMSEDDGLRLLQVGETRGDAVHVLFGLSHQGFLQFQQRQYQHPCLVAQKQAHVVGRLIVARAPGAQFAAQGAEALGEQALDKGVHVFVGSDRFDAPSGEILVDALQGLDDLRGFRRVQQTGALQLVGVGLGAGDVIGSQAKIGPG